MSPAGEPRERSQSPLRVLVVEDEATTLELLTEILESRGHEVEPRRDAESGWAAYERSPHDLVLLDLRLPGMGGLELCRRIRGAPGTAETVVVIVTAVQKREALESALAAGADDYIEKPVNRDLLHVRLGLAERGVLDRRSRSRSEDRVVRKALEDPLTGLASRRFLLERIAHAGRRKRREDGFLYAVLEVDLDDFAGLRRRLGNAAGDAVLRAVAGRLEECVRAVDTVARFEDDRFGILLDGLNDISDPSRVAARIHDALTEPVEADGEAIPVTAGIGIALSATDYGEPVEFLRDAHKALLRAKEQGPASTQMFDPVTHARAMARVELESRIRRAAENRQMVLRYLPVEGLESGRVEGVEALVRWNDESRGLVAPSEFIQVAEETGLIVPMGWTLLEEALARLRGWLRQVDGDRPLYLSVNLSPRQFGQADALEQIRRRLDGAGTTGDRLHLEISETSLMENGNAAGRLLARLREQSIRIQVDDFGTGYSSLSNLCRFPIDTLKIDRTFIGHMLDSRENLEVVRTIVRLAHNLSMTVVAEGVETEGQLEQLRELGCGLAQGYLFSRPVAPEAVPDLLDDDLLA